jgi:hypothetical protein
MAGFPTSDPILAKQITSKDFDGDIFELGLYVDVDSYREKPFQKTIRYHLNLDDDYNLKKITKAKTKFVVWGQAGTGKTTELKYLAKRLRDKEGGYHVIYFEYPSEFLQFKPQDTLSEIRFIYFLSLIYELNKIGVPLSDFNNGIDLLYKDSMVYPNSWTK